MSSKISKFIPENEAINQVLKFSLLQYHSRINIYKVLERFMFAYESELWAIRKTDEERLSATGVQFIWRNKSYTLLDHKKKIF
jgi:hypothetical protein